MDRVFNLFPLDYGLMKEYTLICMQSRNLKEGRCIIDDSRLSTVLRNVSAIAANRRPIGRFGDWEAS